jgi:hypothetical protein
MTPEYKLGEIVYLKTDVEQLPRMVTGILFTSEHIEYYLSQGVGETRHLAIEISTEIDVLLVTTN